VIPAPGLYSYVTQVTEGAALLRASGSTSKTATRLGCATRSVSAWRAGKLPSHATRAKIARVLGIPADSWLRPVGPQLPKLPVPVEADRATSLERLRAQHARLTAQLERGAVPERSRLAHERLALQVASAIARLERSTKRATRPANPAATLALSASRFFSKCADEIAATPTSLPHTSTSDVSRT
jgi:transcriptional regulator with XRE-family HTH domain